MAAGSTYTPIATNTLGSATASITFSSISGSYTDLIIIMNTAVTSGAPDVKLQFNGDTGTNYSDTYISGNGTAGSSSRHSTQAYIRPGYNGVPTTSTAFHNGVLQIMNYSNTTTYKSVLARTNNTTYGTDLTVGLWRSTSAITSILVGVVGSTFDVGSTFTLYGIASA